MKQLNTLTFLHEDLTRYSAESADALDELETLVTDTHAIEQYSEESGLTLSETEALHLVALTKTPSDLLQKADAKEDWSADYSDRARQLIARASKNIDAVIEIVNMLGEQAKSTNSDEIKSALADIDLSVLPEGVEVDLSFKTVSELHRFHFDVLGKFIREAVTAIGNNAGDQASSDWETVSVLGQYSISTEGWSPSATGCFITEMSTPVTCVNTTHQESVKGLLADIITQPLPVPESELSNILEALRDSIDELKELAGDKVALETEVTMLARFSMSTLSAIRGWGFIYGTVYNTAVQLS